MSLKTTAAPCALLLAAFAATPSIALAEPVAPPTEDPVTTLDSVIVTGRRNPEDPAVVAPFAERQRLVRKADWDALEAKYASGRP